MKNGVDEEKYCDSVISELEELIEKICRIPAPSHHEQARAEFCRKWFEENGCSAYTDDALNVICPVADDGIGDLVVFSAHTDTVFPDLAAMPFEKDEKRMYSPSVGDDTACLAILMLCARYFIQNGAKPKNGILFVANSCEEGLGNLKGIRKIMETYGKRVKAHYSLDSTYRHVVDRCVGSYRYEITVETEGGHSFSGFGKANAIHIASTLIAKLYETQVPKFGDSITTYNVGTIAGGTSVNTIAQSCSFKYEYRSDNYMCMDVMKEKLIRVLASAPENCRVSTKLLGERPCMKGVDEKTQKEMSRMCRQIQEKYSGLPCDTVAGSTDCNIPLSMGIPAVAIGVFDGGGEHTREEYIERESLPRGMRIAMEIIGSYFED